ncbi:hypothetical protein [Kribbella monticola]|uniref:hypothetical protein n=1 Tax=Kribbella monticola TaxID=2185285 RepID=UPI00130092F2|nr:hypothetical protein [Kribbella monticola]
MSFDRPGLPHPGKPANEAEIDETLTEDGVELTDGELDGLEHPGARSEGPVPNEPRHRAHPAAEGGSADGVPAYGQVDGEPVDDPAHDDPAHDDPAHDRTD